MPGKILSLVLLFLGCWACGPATLYEADHPLPESGWTYADHAAFSFSVADTAKQYDLILSLDHSPEFPYQNFYVRLQTALPSGVIDTQRLSLQLAGDFGAWLGDCSASSCAIDIPILEAVRYRKRGNYGLTVEQFSRDNPLEGIGRIGLRVVEAE